MSNETKCSACYQEISKKSYHCGSCNNLLCKACVHFLDEDSFAFMKKVPDELKHTTYCPDCNDKIVTPAMDEYQSILKRGKDVYIFYKKAKNVPLIKKCNIKVTVADCPDRDETILRLGFMAAQQSYNALIDVEVLATKVRINGYQKSSWSGSAFPANVNVSRITIDIS